MSSRRTLILIGAVVIGGLAAFLTLSYVRGVENRSDEKAQMVDVVVASGPVTKGSEADDAIANKQIVIDQRPRGDLPANPIRRLADIEGQVAALDLTGGEVITSSMFVSGADLTGSNAAEIDDGYVAMSLQLDEAAGLGGLLKPGDKVNVMARYCSGDECPLTRPDGLNDGANYDNIFDKPATYVLQNVEVYAIGQSLGTPVAAAPASGEEGATTTTAPPTTGGTITLELTPEDAALLASVRDSELYLTLNPPDYKPVPIPFFGSMAVLPGQAGESASGDGNGGK